MSEKDIKELLDYEYGKGNIRKLTKQEIKNFHKKFNETLEYDDYYFSISDKESDAAYSYRFDIFDEMIEEFKIA